MLNCLCKLPMEEEIDWSSALCQAIQDESIDPELSILNRLSPELILQILSHLPWNQALVTAPVSSVFRDLIQSASLWSSLKELDFTGCCIPLAKNILRLSSMCPGTVKLKLSEIIIEDDDVEEETDEIVTKADGEDTEEVVVHDIDLDLDDDSEAEDDHMDDDRDDGDQPKEKKALSAYDKVLRSILKYLQQLKEVSLESENISGGTIEVISEGRRALESIQLSSTQMLRSKDIEKLLSRTASLTQLHIIDCNLNNPFIRHKNREKLALTSLSLVQCGVRKTDIALIGHSCPQLKHLNLSGSSVFDTFGPPDVSASNFQFLETVDLTNCRDMEQVSLEDMEEVQTIDTTQSAYLMYVKLKCPKLSHLKLDSCSSLSQLVVHSDCLESMELRPHFPVLSRLDIKCKKLKKLSLYNCPVLRRDQIVGIDNLAEVRQVTLRCVQVTFDDIGRELFPKLEAVEEMSVQGFGSSSLELSSKTLKSLECQELSNFTNISLDTPQLCLLSMTGVRGLVEEDLVHKLPHSLSELRFCDVSGLHGSLLSDLGSVLVSLSTLVIKDCHFMKKLTLVDWPSLKFVSVGSCAHIKQIHVRGDSIQRLQFWWLHLSDFSVNAPHLEQLDLKGSDFHKFQLNSQTLDHLEVSGLCIDVNESPNDVYIRCPSMVHLWIQRSPLLTLDVVKNIMEDCPNLSEFHVIGSTELREFIIPFNIKSLKLATLPHLTEILLHPECKLKSMSLSGLPKLNLNCRRRVLEEMSPHLENLELRLVNEEKSFQIVYPDVQCLSVDQGLHLDLLEIRCPKLKSLRIKGCPNLTALVLDVDSISEVDISQSMPLNSLTSLHIASPTAKNLAKILGRYCPRLQHLILNVKFISLADLVRFGLWHRSMERISVHSGAQMDEQLRRQLPKTFLIPHDVLERENKTDIVVSFM